MLYKYLLIIFRNLQNNIVYSWEIMFAYRDLWYYMANKKRLPHFPVTIISIKLPQHQMILNIINDRNLEEEKKKWDKTTRIKGEKWERRTEWNCNPQKIQDYTPINSVLNTWMSVKLFTFRVMKIETYLGKYVQF